MKTRVAVAIIATAIAMILLSSALTAEFDAARSDPKTDVITLSGEIVLDEDMVFDKGSNISISDDTTIDLNSHYMVFGEESVVGILGGLKVSCRDGGVIVGSNTTMVVLGLVIPPADREVEYTFDGSLVLDDSKIKSGKVELSFIPNGDDHCVYALFDNTVVSIEDPKLTINISKSGADAQIGFESFSTSEKEYDGDELIQVTTLTAIPDDTDDVAGLYIDADGVHLKKLGIKELHSVSHHMDTDVFTHVDIIDIGPTSYEQTEDLTLIIKTAARSLEFWSETSGNVDSLTIISEVYLEFEIDEEALEGDLRELVIDHRIVSTENAIKYVKATAVSAKSTDKSGMTVKYLSDLVFTIDRDEIESYYMEFSCNDGQDAFKATSEQIDIRSLGLTTALSFDIDAITDRMVIQKNSPDSLLYKMDAEDLDVQVSDLELAVLYNIYARTGSIDIQQVLDHSHRLSLASSNIEVDADGDGIIDMTAQGMNSLLCENSRHMNTLTVSADLLTVTGEYGQGHGTVSLTDVYTYIETNSSLSECIDSFTEGIHFTTDARADIQINFSGITLDYEKESVWLSVFSSPVSPTSPPNMLISLSEEHSMYTGFTTIDGDLSTVGYYISAKRFAEFTAPEGTQEIDFRTRDLTGSFKIGFGDLIEFKFDLDTDWNLDFRHYDIEFQMDSSSSNLSLNHGKLSIKDYDRSQEGILEIFHLIADNDFWIDTRASLSANTIFVYKDYRETLYNQYYDPELDVRGLYMELERGDHRLITIDKATLDITYADGSETVHSLDHLDIYSDLSGNPVEPSFFEKYALNLLAVFSIISCALIVILIVFRIKRPELFRFTE